MFNFRLMIISALLQYFFIISGWTVLAWIMTVYMELDFFAVWVLGLGMLAVFDFLIRLFNALNTIMLMIEDLSRRLQEHGI